jgi:acyl-CoA oxidase
MGALVEGSMTTKLTVQLNLFGGTLLSLGTERHLSVVRGVDTLATVGCFALTELGYGNNAVRMETTAHYDAERAEFVINSPTPLSQKYWITNGAYHCNYALVFAQLIMPGGRGEGVHVFLVRVRDASHKICPGIEIEDMGEKFGANG